MNDIRIDGKLSFHIDNIGFVSLERNRGHRFEYKNGKGLYSFIYLESGAIEYTIPKMGKTDRLEKGSVFFIPKNLPYHAAYLGEKTAITIIVFDVVGEIPEALKKPALQRNREFSDVFRSASLENLRDPLFLASQIYALLSLLAGERREQIPKKYRKILPAVEEIQKHYYDQCPIAHYAERCGMSESNFRKLFSEYTGKSPTQYRNWMRICQVKKMLKSGEFSIGEAADLAGFSNMSFFYENYRKYREEE